MRYFVVEKDGLMFSTVRGWVRRSDDSTVFARRESAASLARTLGGEVLEVLDDVSS